MTKSTAPVSAAKPSVDELVLQLFNTVKQKQQDIAASERPQWVTSCTIGTNPESVTDRINLQTVSDEAKLVDLYGFLLQKYGNALAARTELGLSTTGWGWKWMGYGLEQWRADIKTRLAQIALTAKRAELKTLEARLDRLITTEQRRELELAAIQKEMGL